MNKMVEENAELNRYVLRFLKKGVDRLWFPQLLRQAVQEVRTVDTNGLVPHPGNNSKARGPEWSRGSMSDKYSGTHQMSVMNTNKRILKSFLELTGIT